GAAAPTAPAAWPRPPARRSPGTKDRPAAGAWWTRPSWRRAPAPGDQSGDAGGGVEDRECAAESSAAHQVHRLARDRPADQAAQGVEDREGRIGTRDVAAVE